MTSNVERSRSKRRKWMGAVSGVCVAALVTVWLRGRGEAEASPAGQTIRVQRSELSVDVVEIGRIQPLERVELKSKVAGQVREVLVNEGDTVKAGQVLLRLDPTDFEREVARARAEVELARSAQSYAELNLERRRRAFGERGASQAEVDLAQSDVQSRSAQLKLAKVALSAAEDRLRYTEILSPLDGTVLARGVEPGEVVSPGVQATFEGKPLLTVGNLATLVAKAELNQIDIAKVKLGQKVALTLDALPGKSYEAEITQVAPASTKAKNKDVDVFPIEATLRLADAALRPGMTADVRISIEKRPSALSVPIESILKENGKSYVTRLARLEGKTTRDKVEVRTGVRNDRDVEVLSGVQEGDELLVDPASAEKNEVKL